MFFKKKQNTPTEPHWASTIGEDHEEALNLLTQDNLPLLDRTEFDVNFVLLIPEKEVDAIKNTLADDSCDNINIGDSQEGIVQIEVSFFEARVTKDFYLGTIAKLTQLAEAHGGEYDGWFGYISDD